MSLALKNVHGTLNVNGRLSLEDNGSGGPTEAVLNGNVDYLGGTGAIETTNTTNNFIRGATGASLDISGDLHIRGLSRRCGRDI